RLPDVLAVGIDKGNVHPELRLRAERARRQGVPRIGVLYPVGERQIPADARSAFDVGTVDVAAVLHHLLSELVPLVELLEVLVEYLPGVFTVERICPAF